MAPPREKGKKGTISVLKEEKEKVTKKAYAGICRVKKGERAGPSVARLIKEGKKEEKTDEPELKDFPSTKKGAACPVAGKLRDGKADLA